MVLKKHLLIERGNKCEKCGNTEWFGQPIALEVHHIDENRQNNDIHNLIILCPNCHKFLTLHLFSLKELQEFKK